MAHFWPTLCDHQICLCKNVCGSSIFDTVQIRTLCTSKFGTYFSTFLGRSCTYSAILAVDCRSLSEILENIQIIPHLFIVRTVLLNMTARLIFWTPIQIRNGINRPPQISLIIDRFWLRNLPVCTVYICANVSTSQWSEQTQRVKREQNSIKLIGNRCIFSASFIRHRSFAGGVMMMRWYGARCISKCSAGDIRINTFFFPSLLQKKWISDVSSGKTLNKMKLRGNKARSECHLVSRNDGRLQCRLHTNQVDDNVLAKLFIGIEFLMK